MAALSQWMAACGKSDRSALNKRERSDSSCIDEMESVLSFHADHIPLTEYQHV